MTSRTRYPARCEEEAAAYIHGVCLKNGPPSKVGVELEWLIRDPRDPAAHVPASRIGAAVRVFTGHERLPSSSAPGVLPSGSLLTAEPGGQLEVSSLPADSLAGCVHATMADLAVLRAAIADAGLELAGVGLDPIRAPRRILDLPRYAAMEEFFDRGGPWGRRMMCGTASVQASLDAGDESDGVAGYRYRWRLLHAIGPVIVAAFANSPLREGRPTGWKSSRQQVWAHLDRGRTRPVHSGPIGSPRSLNRGGDPRDAWVAYALDAEVMLIRGRASRDWSAPPGLTLRQWLRGAGAVLREPDTDDVAYHLSTLFPPVRPRGHFEVRVADAQPGDCWIVPLAVTAALAGDARAADTALAAASRIHGGLAGDPWLRAARVGPADAAIAQASRDCFEAARAALQRASAPAAVIAAVDAFIDAYVGRDRCPADDLIEETCR
jgi:ergothioneine biosynthesis glutamate--cysteine ligase EgtA